MRRGSTPAEVGRRNLWAVSLTSFLTDLSSQMVLSLLPLFLVGPLGVRAGLVGLIEGVAEATASLLKAGSGWWSDRLGARKGLAVAGYGISSLAKPLFLLAGSWMSVAGVRWLDRIGKGVRTAPRDALLADSVRPSRRGFGFGLHRAADTAGAALGLGVALAIVFWRQGNAQGLGAETFRWVVLVSIVPAFLAVAVLAAVARDVPRDVPGSETRVRSIRQSVPAARPAAAPAAAGRSVRALGRPFFVFLAIAAVFELGNAADAFIVLLADERGLSVVGVLAMLLTMNLVYAGTSTLGGVLGDRLGRRLVLAVGWSLYAMVYLGLAQATTSGQVWAWMAAYGLYYGLSYGTARALIADLAPPESRGKAFGLFAATLGLLDIPASVIAGVLWHGMGDWTGLGASAPFYFGAAMASVATVALALWRPPMVEGT